MYKHLIKFLTLPFEWFIHFLAMLIFMLLYGQIVVTPMIVLALVGTASFNFVVPELAMYVVYVFSFVGFVIGVVWAEHVRKKYSIFGFHGYISGHPEIDGWQQPEKGIVFRQGNLTKL